MILYFCSYFQINRFNLLFIDAPLGTGFSTPVNNDQIPKTVDENGKISLVSTCVPIFLMMNIVNYNSMLFYYIAAEHLALILESFYTVHEGHRNSPLYIFGQAHGAQLAIALAAKLHEVSDYLFVSTKLKEKESNSSRNNTTVPFGCSRSISDGSGPAFYFPGKLLRLPREPV